MVGNKSSGNVGDIKRANKKIIYTVLLSLILYFSVHPLGSSHLTYPIFLKYDNSAIKPLLTCFMY